MSQETQVSDLAVVGIRFQPAGKLYHFAAPANLELAPNVWAVVETTYGIRAGQVAAVDCELPKGIDLKDLRPVLRRASGLDMARYQVMLERAKRMLTVAREEVEAMNIELRIVAVEFSLDGQHALVLCGGNLSNQVRRTLKRRLGSRMSCRVDLRGIGPRDQAKALDGYGVCGEKRCCSRFLTDFQAVSIRMAKDQSISMAPTDITGMCGRLRCCLAYEHQVYKDASKGFPKRKSRVKTPNGLGKVVDWDILKEQVIVEIPPHGPRRDRDRFRFGLEEVEVVPRE